MTALPLILTLVSHPSPVTCSSAQTLSAPPAPIPETLPPAAGHQFAGHPPPAADLRPPPRAGPQPEGRPPTRAPGRGGERPPARGAQGLLCHPCARPQGAVGHPCAAAGGAQGQGRPPLRSRRGHAGTGAAPRSPFRLQIKDSCDDDEPERSPLLRSPPLAGAYGRGPLAASLFLLLRRRLPIHCHGEEPPRPSRRSSATTTTTLCSCSKYC